MLPVHRCRTIAHPILVVWVVPAGTARNRTRQTPGRWALCCFASIPCRTLQSPWYRGRHSEIPPIHTSTHSPPPPPPPPPLYATIHGPVACLSLCISSRIFPPHLSTRTDPFPTFLHTHHPYPSSPTPVSPHPQPSRISGLHPTTLFLHLIISTPRSSPFFTHPWCGDITSST